MSFQIRTVIIILILSIWSFSPARAAFPVRPTTGNELAQPENAADNEYAAPMPGHGGNHYTHHAVHHYYGRHGHYRPHYFTYHYTYTTRYYTVNTPYYEAAGSPIVWSSFGLPLSFFVVGGIFGVLSIVKVVHAKTPYGMPTSSKIAIIMGVLDILVSLAVIVALFILL